MSFLHPLVALLIAGPLAGCLVGTGGDCVADGDCIAGRECTRTGECVLEGRALRVVVRWTVAGEAPTPSRPEPCAPVGELEIRFQDQGGDMLRYRPVPCDLGQATYDKMPPRLVSVGIVAYDPAGRVLDSADQRLEPRGETTVLLDLIP